MLMKFQLRRIAGTMMKTPMVKVDGFKTPFKVKFPNLLQMKLSGLTVGNETLILQGLFHFFLPIFSCDLFACFCLTVTNVMNYVFTSSDNMT